MHNKKQDVRGNYLLLDITIDDCRFTLANIYGPNTDDPQFYENIVQLIRKIENDDVVICGDWNLILNPDCDMDNYLHIIIQRLEKKC